jgi:diaminohydroxyphosphoribosylaminopyrimidine deaminase/5-amino-6-(5-phosphoribosylamino)uracil reductase
VQTTVDSEVTTTSQSEFDERMLRRALDLATKGVGQVSPGPLVGCVITDSSGAVAGEGYYVFENLKHAETIALAEAGDKARGGTAYVSLEPHAHHGRTPPCSDALIAAGIKRVVAPIEDLNPKVSGKGFAHLREAGIEVSTGQLANEAERINEKYLHFMRTGLPFVHLKLAVSLDGKIATRTGSSQWITGPESLARVQSLRHEYDAILVGVGTALKDDPLLTDRSGLTRRRSLLRIVMDDRLQLPVESKLVSSSEDAPLIVVANERADPAKARELRDRGAEVITLHDARNPSTLLRELAERSVQSVLVEGGARVAGHFVDAGAVSKVSFFIAPKIVGGVEAPGAIGGKGVETMTDAWSLQDVEIARRGGDVEVTGYFQRQ